MKRLTSSTSHFIALVALALFLSACAMDTVKIGVKQQMSALVVAPKGAGPFPGVLVLHTSMGLQAADLAFAKRLADAGYVCLVPYYLATYGIGQADRGTAFSTYHDQILADLTDGIARLRRMDTVAGQKVGAVGFSNGGYWAAALAASGRADAAVSYYGVFSQFGNATRQRLRQAVGQSTSPMLLLHGENDSIQPPEGARFVANLMKQSGRPYELHLYPADHNFAWYPGPIEDDAWRRTLEFLSTNLR